MKTFRQFVAEKYLTPKDKEKIRTMDPHTFDQTSKGWREIAHSGEPDAHDRASRVAALYDRVHSIRGTNNWKSSAPKGDTPLDPDTGRFHVAQTAAFAGNNKRALRHLNNVKSKGDPQFRKYKEATTAYIQGNKRAFNKATKGPNYNKETIQRLRKGFGSDGRIKPYKDAY
jgi:hypothetical protein